MRTGGSGVKEDLFSKYILFIFFSRANDEKHPKMILSDDISGIRSAFLVFQHFRAGRSGKFVCIFAESERASGVKNESEMQKK